MRPNRDIANSSLAFIDVMSCGLGAVVLLLILVDFSYVVSEEEIEIEPVVNETLANQNMLEQKNILIAEKKNKSLAIEKTLSDLSEAMLSLNIEKIKSENAVTTFVGKYQEIPNDKAGSGELIGLSVEGRRILLALDVSASMSSKNLIDIILGLSDLSSQQLASGQKWHQAKGTLMWLLKNAPDSSEINVLVYSDKVKPLMLGWRSKKDALATTTAEIKTVTPIGGTSLASLLETVSKMVKKPTNMYIITDGLPTISGSKVSGLKKIKDCFGLPSKNKYVDGKCRVALFNSAVKRFENNNSIETNIILLPLEGDPKAAPLYWRWANKTGGILFSPAQGWPPR